MNMPCVATLDLARHRRESAQDEALDAAIDDRLDAAIADGELLDLIERMPWTRRQDIEGALKGVLTHTPTVYDGQGNLTGTVNYTPRKPSRWSSAGKLLLCLREQIRREINDE